MASCQFYLPPAQLSCGVGANLPNNSTDRETEASEKFSRSHSRLGATLIPKPNQVHLDLPKIRESDWGPFSCPWLGE